MYGIVNKAIEELVVTKYGQEKWEIIKEKSGVEIDYFISNEPYDDDITFKLAEAIEKEMHMPVNEVFVAFGEWWILKTGQEKYGKLMQAGGASLKEFLVNLPMFHNRIMLIYPKLMPPEFKVSDIEDNSINIHYFSKGEGLQGFVWGILKGLGDMFKTPVTVELIQSRTTGDSHEIFKVRW
jgi:hypothetical protein